MIGVEVILTPAGESRWTAFDGAEELPPERIGSVRCIVRVGHRIVVCETASGPHTWPGGRIEPGETHARCAAREVHEETGWHVDVATMRRVGHLEVQPWDVVQPIYVVDATSCDDEAWRDTEGWELSSSLMTVADAIDHVGTGGVNAAILRAIAPRLLAEMFADCISRGDVDALAELMTEDHHLDLFDTEHVRGRDAAVDAHRGYCASFPSYRIHPHELSEIGDGAVEILGHTTGSHLGLPDDEEARLAMRWICETTGDGRVGAWRLRELASNRSR